MRQIQPTHQSSTQFPGAIFIPKNNQKRRTNMKKKLLSLILIVAMLPTTANAKTTPYYTLKGTIHNFTYTQIYKDGTVIKGKGFDIYTTDGNIWEMTDTDTDYHFSENATVNVKFHNNKTPKDKTDDRIISVKKAN